MKRISLILAALALLLLGGVGFSTSAQAATTFDPTAAPKGTHLQTGSPDCSIDGLDVSCTSYELAGVGNKDAEANLSVTYSATIVCRNNGGNLSDSQHQGDFTKDTSSGEISPKNGRLTVPSLFVTAPTVEEFLAQQSCPNPNWDAELQGDITLSSFTYTLHFAGFTGDYITITG